MERKGKGRGEDGRKRRETVNEHNIKLVYDPISSYGK
jgi:hypothetical protein